MFLLLFLLIMLLLFIRKPQKVVVSTMNLKVLQTEKKHQINLIVYLVVHVKILPQHFEFKTVLTKVEYFSHGLSMNAVHINSDFNGNLARFLTSAGQKFRCSSFYLFIFLLLWGVGRHYIHCLGMSLLSFHAMF